MRFPAKITSSCVWVALIELFYIGMPVVRTDGRSVYGHVITKFSGMGRFILPMVLRWRTLSARESSAITLLRDVILVNLVFHMCSHCLSMLITSAECEVKDL